MVGPFAKVKLSHVIWRNLGAVTGGYNIVVLGGSQVRQWTSGGLRLLAISAEAKDCGDCCSLWQTSCIYGTPSMVATIASLATKNSARWAESKSHPTLI